MEADAEVELALFDLDKTLVQKDTAGLIIFYEWKNGLTSWKRVMRVAFWRLLYTMGWVQAEAVARRVLAWNEGRDEAELRRHASLCFEQYVRPLISDSARAEVESQRAAGRRVVVVTASTAFVAEPVARFLGIEDLLCTRVRVQGGRLTDQLEGPLCYAEGKLQHVREFVERQQLNLSAATFYTDSVTDLPTLLAVGHPVTVNPDPRLKRIARSRGWPVLRW